MYGDCGLAHSLPVTVSQRGELKVEVELNFLSFIMCACRTSVDSVTQR